MFQIFRMQSALSRLPRILRFPLIFLWLLWLAGQWLRDSTSISAFLFYIPSPVLLAILLVGAIVSWRGKHLRFAVALSVVAIVPAIFVLFVENRFFHESKDPTGKHLRLVHWNVCRGWLGWDAIQDQLLACKPDVCVISEFPAKADIGPCISKFGKAWSGVKLGGMAVIARGELTGGQWLAQRGGVKAYGIVWQSPQGPCKLLIVDLDSSLFLPRGPRLQVIRKLMDKWDPDIVVGDFNAPRRSIGLDPLPVGFVHAYDKAGSGWSYTWPPPFPTYAIDQCITGRRVEPAAYSLETSARSDHRRQVLEFGFVTASR